MYYRFERLDIWKLSRQFVNVIYTISGDFPESERFGLTSQLQRAALSIMLNIAEGSDRGSDKEFIRFLRISLSSLHEVVSGLYVAQDLDYISEERFTYVYNGSHMLAKKIHAFIRTLNK